MSLAGIAIGSVGGWEVKALVVGAATLAISVGVYWYGHTRYEAGVSDTTTTLTARFGVEKKVWADQEASEITTAVAAYRDSVSEANRRVMALQEIVRNDQHTQTVLRVAYAGLSASHDSLQRAATALADGIRAGSGASPSNSTTATSGDAATDAARMFAQLFGELDERAGILAKTADERGASGLVCQQSYSALSAPLAASAASAN